MTLRSFFRQVQALAVASLLLCTAGAARADDEKKSDQAEGVEHFYKGEIAESIAAWDRHLAASPADRPYHWQRGIALYYACRFTDGRAQFEEHQKVNTQDVENAVWHYLCVAREKSVEEAKKLIIPIKGDQRVPMAEVHALFAGSGTEEAVLKAAEAAGPPESPAGRNARCYAHLYLGLYYEPQGNLEKTRSHMLKAAWDFRMNHYMGKVAQVHCQLRGWTPEEPEKKPAEEKKPD